MPLTAEVGGKKVVVSNITEALELSESEDVKEKSELFTVEIPEKNVRFTVHHLGVPVIREEVKPDKSVESAKHHNELVMYQRKLLDGPWVAVMRYTARNHQEIMHVLGDAAMKICKPTAK